MVEKAEWLWREQERERETKITIEQRSIITEQLNIVEQMGHLMKYSYIKKRVKEGTLNVMGWYYNIEKGEIYNYDNKLKRFIRLEWALLIWKIYFKLSVWKIKAFAVMFSNTI